MAWIYIAGITNLSTVKSSSVQSRPSYLQRRDNYDHENRKKKKPGTSLQRSSSTPPPDTFCHNDYDEKRLGIESESSGNITNDDRVTRRTDKNDIDNSDNDNGDKSDSDFAGDDINNDRNRGQQKQQRKRRW